MSVDKISIQYLKIRKPEIRSSSFFCRKKERERDAIRDTHLHGCMMTESKTIENVLD